MYYTHLIEEIYSRLPQGLVSLVAVLDWCRRYGLSGVLAVTLDGPLCRDTLPQALGQGRRPAIVTTDQGGQCTRQDGPPLWAHEGLRIGRDGCGRAFDKVFVERLWRTVQSAEVSCKDYTTIRKARQRLGASCTCSHHERWHQALSYQTPAAV